jgi:hypothetical protein
METRIDRPGIIVITQTTGTANAPATAHPSASSPNQSPGTDRRKPASPPGPAVLEPITPPPALTPGERRELHECEDILERGLATFFEVGNALLRLRESRLYRATHPTFEQYCHERWNIGRSYASRVIAAAERIKLLPNDTSLPKPANEFQVRPFLKLPPKEFPAGWKRAIKNAKGGRITPGVVQAVVQELLSGRRGRTPLGKKPKGDKPKTKLPLGQVLVLLYETKQRLGKGEIDTAIELLERIERLLCET